ncbi:Anti-sigma-B factor antagonist [compost metagenome]
MNMSRNEKFTVTSHLEDGICTVALGGELDLSVAPELRQVMEPLAIDETIDLVINLKELKYIDSTGIGILLSILKTRHGMDSSFLVEEVPDQIQKLFDMTGIAKFFAAENSH